MKGVSSSNPVVANEFVYCNVKLLFSLVNCGTCRYIPRDGNGVVHLLASFASSYPRDSILVDACLLFISNFVCKDYLSQ